MKFWARTISETRDATQVLLLQLEFIPERLSSAWACYRQIGRQLKDPQLTRTHACLLPTEYLAPTRTHLS